MAAHVHVEGLHGQRCSTNHCRTGKWPPRAAASQTSSSQGNGWGRRWRAHCKNSRSPCSAAQAAVRSSQERPADRTFCSCLASSAVSVIGVVPPFHKIIPLFVATQVFYTHLLHKCFTRICYTGFLHASVTQVFYTHLSTCYAHLFTTRMQRPDRMASFDRITVGFRGYGNDLIQRTKSAGERSPWYSDTTRPLWMQRMVGKPFTLYCLQRSMPFLEWAYSE